MTSATLPTAPHATQTATDPAAFYREHGYYVAKGLFAGRQLADLQTDFERIVAQLAGSAESINARWDSEDNDRFGRDSVVLHTHNVHRYSARWMQALFHQPLLDTFAACLGSRDIVLNHTKLFQKPAEIGAPFPPHQDYSYFPTERDTCMAAVIHLSDADDEMGCLRVAPGSHRLGRVDNSAGQGDISEIQRRFPLETLVPIAAKAGDVAFFSYFTVHGSLPNRSARTRKTVLLQVYRGDDRVEAGNTHVDEQLVLSGFCSRMTRQRASD